MRGAASIDWHWRLPYSRSRHFSLLRWNPIYPAIVAMGTGALAAIACRPDLKARTVVGALLFLTFYGILLLALEATAPGYIGRTWNIPALSGLLIAGLPVEELLFAAAFGGYWSAVYEHLAWSTSVMVNSPAGSTAKSAELSTELTSSRRRDPYRKRKS